MAQTDIDLYSTQAAHSGIPPVGCLPFFALPPLAVIATGLLLTLILSQIDLTSQALASTNERVSQISINNEGGESAPQIASLFTPEIQNWSDKIYHWSQTWELDPNLVATVIQIESCGDPGALSSAGAMGLFQVMPYHFAEGEDPLQPSVNAARGLHYLKRALEAQGGTVRRALAGYNGGITGAKRPESAWPAETVRYVYWGTGIYADAQEGKGHSARLDEWLNHGGASLCAQAANRLGIEDQ